MLRYKITKKMPDDGRAFSMDIQMNREETAMSDFSARWRSLLAGIVTYLVVLVVGCGVIRIAILSNEYPPQPEWADDRIPEALGDALKAVYAFVALQVLAFGVSVVIAGGLFVRLTKKPRYS